MKIDTKNPFHWLYLVIFSLNTLAAAILRPFVRRKSGGLVLLYGHKLNSNLKAVYDFSRNSGENGPALCFLTIDPGYYRELKTAGERVIIATNPLNIIIISRCDVIVSDHGLHALKILLRWSDIRFVDVWHGIPFKGFDADDFRTQHAYSEVWLTSALLKEMYATKFGFDRSILHVIGYARTDALINKSADYVAIRERLGIAGSIDKVILFAPTWQQDENNRNLFPFDTCAEVFFEAIERLCDRLSVTCVFRTHLNTRTGDSSRYDNIIFAPHAAFPDTEEILLACDALVCDWSSIAFDYLLLNRPTVFLDVKAPFKKGFSLDESYRFGEVVKSLDDMVEVLETYIRQPETYWAAHGEQCEVIKKELYDSNADGHAASRCYKRLERLVSGLTDS